MHSNLKDLFTFKTLHALCGVSKGDKMKAFYYVSCVVYGRNPLWAVWRVSDGAQIGWAGSKGEIEESYPNLTWRRVMARWSLKDDGNSKAAARRQALKLEFEGKPQIGKRKAA